MQIGLILLLSFIVSMSLTLRLKDKITRIFSVAAICSYFLAMLVMSTLPSTEVTKGYTLFVSSVFLIGIIFTLVALINIFFQNRSKNQEKAETNMDGGKQE